jgi:hypothetical protein
MRTGQFSSDGNRRDISGGRRDAVRDSSARERVIQPRGSGSAAPHPVLRYRRYSRRDDTWPAGGSTETAGAECDNPDPGNRRCRRSAVKSSSPTRLRTEGPATGDDNGTNRTQHADQGGRCRLRVTGRPVWVPRRCHLGYLEAISNGSRNLPVTHVARMSASAESGDFGSATRPAYLIRLRVRGFL